jgi:hypothetical protein
VLREQARNRSRPSARGVAVEAGVAQERAGQEGRKKRLPASRVTRPARTPGRKLPAVKS